MPWWYTYSQCFLGMFCFSHVFFVLGGGESKPEQQNGKQTLYGYFYVIFYPFVDYFKP